MEVKSLPHECYGGIEINRQNNLHLLTINQKFKQLMGCGKNDQSKMAEAIN